MTQSRRRRPLFVVARPLFALSLAAAGVFACEHDSKCGDDAKCTGPESDAGPEVARSAVLRDPAPAAPENDVDALVRAQNGFALDLFRAAAPPGEATLISPFSVHQALAMAYAGARSDTRTAMAAVLGAFDDEAAFHRAQNALDLRLAAEGGDEGENAGPTFRVANSIFAQNGMPFLPDFLDTLGLNYGAGVALVDYQHAAEAARESINAWVSERTEGHIPELLLPGQVGSDTRLTLVNAVYFLGRWATAFDVAATYPEVFHAAAGDRDASFMHLTADLAAAETDEAVAVELPYAGGTLSMQALMPKGELGAFEAALDPETLDTWTDALVSARTNLAMPRFEMRARFGLKKALGEMGMGPAFAEADFSGITHAASLGISEVVHEAWMRVDEAGTEAAAATAVLFDGGAALDEPAVQTRNVRLDRPFLLLLRERMTGAIVFIGRVVSP